MPITQTPLRYPGGKTQLSPLLRDVIATNELQNGVYAEPFAGGAGLALDLLLSDWVSEIWINDLDPAIFSFWHSVLNATEELCRRIECVAVTMDEWHKQKEILGLGRAADSLSLAFAVLFLNRTNRSGILKGGVIGGLQQNGNYKLGCRFNKVDICRKIRRIALQKNAIHLTNLDAAECLRQWDDILPEKSLINIDPPYFEQGQALYMNHYKPDDHAELAQVIHNLKHCWMLTYDDVPEVECLYEDLPIFRKSLLYSAQAKRKANELVVFSPKLKHPNSLSPTT